MFPVRRLLFLIVAIASLSLLAACQEGSSSTSGSGPKGNDAEWKQVYGDGTNDVSDVIARVGDIRITSRDLELYLDELPAGQKGKYQGADGERLLLKRMIENALLIQGAVKKKLYNDPDVARTIISQRRNTLTSAMINYGLLRDRKPTDEEAREYFQNNRGNYRQLGLVSARHIETMTKEDAEKAYERLVEGGPGNQWLNVMSEMSVNEETRKQEGSVGWFNQGGTIPMINGTIKFTTIAYNLDMGLNPPFMVTGRWHVVEILKRENERPMTFNEAKDQVEVEMLAGWQDGLIRDYYREARKTYPVEKMDRFAPGQGLTVDELFSRAMMVADGAQKIELLNLIYTDYPESDRADDALFMAANVALESWTDVKVAERYLRLLLEEYPDSDLASDAQFLKDNLYNPDIINPKSVDDLRK